MSIYKLYLLVVFMYTPFFFYAQINKDNHFYLTKNALLTDGDYVIIGKENKKFYALSNISIKKETRLLGQYIDSLTNPLPTIPQNVSWHFYFINKNNLYIQNNTSKLFLSYKNKNIYTTSNKNSIWNVHFINDSLYLITPKDHSNISLSTWTSTNNIIFGLYTTDTINENNTTIQLFKKGNIFENEKGKVLLPKNKEKVIFGYDTIGYKPNQIINLQDLLLQGNFVSNEDEHYFIVDSLSSSTFNLQYQDSLKLQYNLQLGKLDSPWTIKNGYIQTIEEAPRFLVYINHSFQTKSLSELKKDAASPCIFYSIAPKPDSIVKKNNLKILLGGWNAKKLYYSLLNSHINIDLTKASLPKNPIPFINLHNKLFFIKKEQIFPNIEKIWKNVVCDGHLLSQLYLFDKQDFTTTTPIEYNKNKIHFYRKINGNGEWETLCIPFKASVPKNVQAEKLITINNLNLIFEPVDYINAYEPIIIRSLYSSNDSISLDLVNNENGIIKDYSPNFSFFLPNFTQLNIESPLESKYFLSFDGTTFTLADKGSILYPFHAYIYLPKQLKEKKLNIKHLPLNIPPLIDTRKKYIYDLYGKKHIQQDSGIYIFNHKKYIIK